MPVASTERPMLKGMVLVWNIFSLNTATLDNGYVGSLDSSYSLLPSELKADPSDKQITLFIVTEKYDGVKSDFTVGVEPGYADIAVVYWPSLEPVGRYSVHAKAGNFTSENQNIDARIVEWIQELNKIP